MNRMLFCALFGAAMLFSLVAAQAATLTVNSDGDAGGACPGATCTLRQAIATALPGDTINFAAGISTINLTTGELLIDKNLTINGPGANLLTVQRSGTLTFRIVEIAAGNLNVTISDLTIAHGIALLGSGGGILNRSSGILTVTGCAISGNLGDGIVNGSDGTVTITKSSISHNGTGGEGGGIDNSGTLTITDSAIFNNSGRGINSRGAATIISSTISGNAVVEGYFRTGAGISNDQGGTLILINSTISNNVAPACCAGVLNQGGTASARNTIIANNFSFSYPDLFGTLTSQGFNLIGNNSGGAITPLQATDQIGTPSSPINPMLGPLQDNGGPTETQALLSGSTAIDKGNSFGSTSDQRGFTRPVDNPAIPNATGGDGSDIGAFEVQVPTTFGNIATRNRVETGDNVLIGGFIITGTQPKKIIVRAIGPSLPLPGALADPVLELRNSSGGLIASNDNWRSDQQAEIIATTIPPSNDLESAIVETLPANGSAYTAIVRGANNGTGIGVVEAYDLNRSVDSKLANVSTRGFVQTGDNVLIGGLIVQGQHSLRVIVRAIAPSLNLAGKLADPTLELHDGNGALIASNDNWRSDQEAEIIATFIPPSNDLESAIVRNFTAGNYTAIVRGVNGNTGVALVEAYGLN
jgi:hypothetical protein